MSEKVTVDPKVQEMWDALTGWLKSYPYILTADLWTWGYSKESFGPMTHERLEGTFNINGVPHQPEGYNIFMNFTLAVTHVEGWDRAILSKVSRAYLHNADFSDSRELDEVSAHIGDTWSKEHSDRSLQHCVTWMIGDSVFILNDLLGPDPNEDTETDIDPSALLPLLRDEDNDPDTLQDWLTDSL